MWREMLSDLLVATGETLYMVGLSGFFALIFGLPLGIFLRTMRSGGLMERPLLHRFFAVLIDATRSIPFVILLIAIMPFTRFIAGTSIGTTAAVVPLALSAIPFVARVVESALNEVSKGLVEAGQAIGATPWQIVCRILLPEAMPALVRGVTLMLITLVGYAAMAGAVGGGGLGDFAIRYGYQRFQTHIMIITVVILIFLVQLIQYIGNALVQYVERRPQ